MPKIQSIKGMNDILPNKTFIWRKIENIFSNIFNKYGYQEIRFPILEKANLFLRSPVEITNSLQKEIYIFQDKKNHYIALRPEGTAGCVRAGIEHGLFHKKKQKLWYIGPMFRYEQPQMGRYRQFHQIGAETYGFSGPEIDIELILMCNRCFKTLGILENIRLEINTLGTFDERKKYSNSLVDYFNKYANDLDNQTKKLINKNPLRILDKNNVSLKSIIENAPLLVDFLGKESRKYFEKFCQLLEIFNLNYQLNPRLVRGLDYYNHTVFEWINKKKFAQGTICAGGRYNNLTKELGGGKIPAIGMAIGLERLMFLIKICSLEKKINIYFILENQSLWIKALKISESIRDHISNIKIEINDSYRSIKSQFKKANKYKADYVVIIKKKLKHENNIFLKKLNYIEKPVAINSQKLLKYFIYVYKK